MTPDEQLAALHQHTPDVLVSHDGAGCQWYVQWWPHERTRREVKAATLPDALARALDRAGDEPARAVRAGGAP